MKIQIYASENRNFGLDLVRAIAIILVVIGHARLFLKNSILWGFPYFRMIDGVDIFFVLSGFLIGGILIRDIHNVDKFGLSHLIYFWKRRWFRTLPNYFLILLANYFFVKYGIINEHFDSFNYKFFLFIQNFNSPFTGFFWESWSLSIEEWFYIFSPILVLVLCRILPNKWAFLSTTLIMILFPTVYRFISFDPSYTAFQVDINIRKVVLMRLDSIGYGLLSAWIFYYYYKLWFRFRNIAAIIGFLILLFIINFHTKPSELYDQTLYFTLTPISILLMLPFFESIRKVNFKGSYFIEHISKISYSMYLINLALVSEVIRDNFYPQNEAQSFLAYFIYWFSVIGISTLIYFYYEKPITDLRDKIQFKF